MTFALPGLWGAIHKGERKSPARGHIVRLYSARYRTGGGRGEKTGSVGNGGALRCSSASGMETPTTRAKKNQIGTSIAKAMAVASGVSSASNSTSTQETKRNR